jgi:hypothetical protein
VYWAAEEQCPAGTWEGRMSAEAAETQDDGPFDPDELVRWQKTTDIPRRGQRRPKKLHGKLDAIKTGPQTVYGIWEESSDMDGESLVEMFRDEGAAERRCAEAPTYNAGSRFEERALWSVREHTVT